MYSAYRMYGSDLTITFPYIITQWSILSQTATYESESMSSTGIHISPKITIFKNSQSHSCMYTVTYSHMKAKAQVQ